VRDRTDKTDERRDGQRLIVWPVRIRVDATDSQKTSGVFTG